MQVYELGYLILPSIPEESLPELALKIRGLMGSPLDGEDPIKVDLSYPLHKTVGSSNYVVNDAYLGWIKFEGDPEEVEKVKEAMEKMEEVVRFILIKSPRETKFTLAKAREVLEEVPAEASPAEASAVTEVVQ